MDTAWPSTDEEYAEAATEAAAMDACSVSDEGSSPGDPIFNEFWIGQAAAADFLTGASAWNDIYEHSAAFFNMNAAAVAGFSFDAATGTLLDHAQLAAQLGAAAAAMPPITIPVNAENVSEENVSSTI